MRLIKELLAKRFYNRERILISLRLGISTIFTSIFIITALSVAIIAYYRISNTVSVLADKYIATVSTSIMQQLSFLLDPVVPAMKLSMLVFKDKSVDPNDTAEIANYTLDLLRIMPQVRMVHWGNKWGGYVISRRQDDGLIITEIVNIRKSPTLMIKQYRDKNGNKIKEETLNRDFSYVIKQRPWYKIGEAINELSWSNAYFFSTQNRLGISLASPIYDNASHPLGIFSIDIELDLVSEFLATHKISERGISFIVDDSGHVIAFPHLTKLFVSRPRNPLNPQLIHLTTINNPLVTQAFQHFKEHNKEKFMFSFNGETYLGSFVPIPYFKQYHWRIGIVVPESDFTGKFQHRYKITLSIIFFFLLICLIFINIFAKRISVPIRKLANELEAIKFFHIERGIPLQSHIKEVFIMSNAIESMKMGLSSFRKYVPENLVRQLIYSGEAARIGGVSRKVTLLFTDIENFTTIAEQVDSGVIMQYLCEYFDEMTHIIAMHKGTIDKYIGDSIMAFWGAPLADEKSTYNVCITVLEFQALLAKLNYRWQQEGRPAFPTRFGIHFGEAVIGNLGSTERLNYTALGESVNITNRLEQLNKLYGTRILVSEVAREQVVDQFIFRIIDKILFTGHMDISNIYELIQVKSDDISANMLRFCQSYEDGFMAYQQKAWDQAIQCFEMALSLYPNDMASQLMITRCRSFKVNPPPEKWNGTWVISSVKEA